MSGLFANGSACQLQNTTPPVTVLPMTFGCWVRPTDIASFRYVTGLSISGSATGYFGLYQWNDNTWNCFINNVGENYAQAGAVTQNAWHFVVCRFITTTNRRIAVLNANGTTAHAQSVTSQATPAVNMITIGAFTNTQNDPFSGQVAEWWYTNSDIQADGAALQDGTLMQLAYGGPFSLPHITKDIIEYRSMRQNQLLENPGENYVNPGRARQIWVNTHSTGFSFNPPLPGTYLRPRDTLRPLMI